MTTRPRTDRISRKPNIQLESLESRQVLSTSYAGALRAALLHAENLAPTKPFSTTPVEIYRPVAGKGGAVVNFGGGGANAAAAAAEPHSTTPVEIYRPVAGKGGAVVNFGGGGANANAAPTRQASLFPQMQGRRGPLAYHSFFHSQTSVPTVPVVTHTSPTISSFP